MRLRSNPFRKRNLRSIPIITITISEEMAPL